MSALTATVVANAPATRRARLVTLRLDGPLAFCAGQAIHVRTAAASQTWTYSIASSPEWTADSGLLELLVGASAAPGHVAAAPPGMRLEIAGPIGTFFVRTVRERSPLLFIGGGCGIAPIRSMIDHLARQPAAFPMSLLYSARERDDFAFIDEFDRHVREGRLTLWQTATRARGADGGVWSGRIDALLLRRVVRDPATTVSFVCGPAAFVATSRTLLRGLGMPASQIHTDQMRVLDDAGRECGRETQPAHGVARRSLEW